MQYLSVYVLNVGQLSTEDAETETEESFIYSSDCSDEQRKKKTRKLRERRSVYQEKPKLDSHSLWSLVMSGGVNNLTNNASTFTSDKSNESRL